MYLLVPLLKFQQSWTNTNIVFVRNHFTSSIRTTAPQGWNKQSKPEEKKQQQQLNHIINVIKRQTTYDEETIKEFFSSVLNSGDIKLARQKGWYCVGCEEYKDVDINNNNHKCEIHLTDLEWRDEENLFFCLSNYQSQIDLGI